MPEIYFGVTNWGYGWVCPKTATLTVGCGGVWQHNPDMKSRFMAFLRDTVGTLPEIPIRGHYLPFRRYRRSPGKNAILLVGDAAGLVEPITGEGIAFAMQSGKFAAEAILEAAKQQIPSLAYPVYRRKYRTIRKIFDQASLMSYLLFPQKMGALFANVLQKSHLPLVKEMDLLADEIGYKDFLQFILTKLGKYVVETITQ
jgi:flavin-dependent dehydrogenase